MVNSLRRSRRVRRAVFGLLAVLAVMFGSALAAAANGAAMSPTASSAASAAAASDPPNHGVDGNGYCTPKWAGNQDCYHQTDTHYSATACHKLASELNQSGIASCQILPPDGKGVIVAYTTSCKQSESIEDCRRRHGTVPVVMQPGNW